MVANRKNIINITDNEQIALGLGIDEYHSRPEISKSQLDLISKTPAHFKCGFRKSTKSMDAGALSHTAILEPAEFDNRYIAGPDVNKNTKIWKAFVAEHAPKIAIDPSTFEIAKNIRESVDNHLSAGSMFQGGLAEMSVFGEIEGVPARCRPDYLVNNYCVDLKKIKSCDDRTIQRSIHNYRYHVQNAFYTDVLSAAGINIDGFVFVFIEMEPPYGVVCKMLTDSAIERGRELYQRDLETYKRCLKDDSWPGYSEHIETIDLPAYSYIEDA